MTIKKYSLSDPDITKLNIGNPNADALDECIIEKIQGIIPSVVLAIPVGFLIALIFDFAGFKIAAILGDWNFYLSSFFVSYILLIYLMRESRQRFRAANAEWKQWRDLGYRSTQVGDLPELKSSSALTACLTSYLPDRSHSDQYQFPDRAAAVGFSENHQNIVIHRLRAAFASISGERSLAMGWVELADGRSLLLFRQIRDDCAIFFLLRHRVTGLVVSLISQRWILCNRRCVSNGKSDYASAEEAYKAMGSEAQKNATKRNDPEWGTLGVWSWVSSYQNNGPPDNADAESELDYYEKLVHVDTVKESHQKQPIPPTHTQVPVSGSDANTSPPRDFL